ncbi:MAG: dTMP kinase [Candidatus Bathyarchaeia archaeon]
MKKGFFVCVEGLDGCGKTTQAKILVNRLKKRSYDAVYTAEPTHGKIGKFIRRYCLHGDKRASSVIEALLFAADRFEHVEKEVIPALQERKIVVSDRYIYSSLAYQGAAGLDLDWIKKVNEHALMPDLALFIDVKPEIVVQRLKPKKSVMENLETQRRVRELYLKFAENGELVKVDGNRSKAEVAKEILSIVLSSLEKANL